MTTRISAHFTLEELTTTSQTRFRDAQVAGATSEPVASALAALCDRILEPIRMHVGGPVRINSGYRSPELNAAVPGSSKTSQHCKGEAADLGVPGFTDADLFALWRWIGWESGLPFGQVIYEDRRPDDPNAGAWIHVSLGAPWRAEARCGQRLTWDPTNGYRSWTAPPEKP